MAYSSIANMGFVLMALASGARDGAPAALLYMALYLPATIGIFAVIQAMWRDGKPVEDWGRLTGQDIETALFDLQEIRLTVSQQVDELRSEAIYAKHVYDDGYQDGYRGLVEGTQGDRNAHASKVSRTDKYHSFFRYYVYSRSNTFWQELNAFIRLLERVRDWRVREQRR
jgi:hypothetical protein